MVPPGRENFKSWCPSRNRFLREHFSSKKKLDRNNIPVYKISFRNAFSLQKRLPCRNRWEKFRAFKQLQLTWCVKAKAFIMCTYKQHRLGYRTACWHFRSVFEGLTLKQPHIDHMLGRIRGRCGFFGASSALLLHCSLALRAPATNILFDNRLFHHVHMHSASSAQVVSAHNFGSSCASPSMLL